MNSPTDRRDPFLAKLVEFSKKAGASKRSRGLRRLFGGDVERQQFNPTQVSDRTPTPLDFSSGGAEPLSPLRERDNKALADLFERDDLEEIHTDVLNRLSLLYPPPYWEEESLDFLEGFV